MYIFCIIMTIIQKMSDEDFIKVDMLDEYLFEDEIYVSNYGEVYNKTTDSVYSYESSSVNLRIQNNVLKNISRWKLTLSVHEMENKEYEQRRSTKKQVYGYRVQNKIKNDIINTDRKIKKIKKDETNLNNYVSSSNNISIDLLKLENTYLKKKNEFEKIKKEYEEQLKVLELLINEKQSEKENINKYDNTYFYIIRPKFNNFYMYVGHTINFENRLYQHKEKTKSCCDTKLYKTIRDTGGWDNWEMIIIDEKICKNKQNALKIEQDWCEKLRPNLNSKAPFS